MYVQNLKISKNHNKLWKETLLEIKNFCVKLYNKIAISLQLLNKNMEVYGAAAAAAIRN